MRQTTSLILVLDGLFGWQVHVDAAKEDCYYQYVHPGATLYVSYQVLKGGDGAIGFAVRRPDGKIVHPYAWKPTSEYEESAAAGGYYSVCLDNQVRAIERTLRLRH